MKKTFFAGTAQMIVALLCSAPVYAAHTLPTAHSTTTSATATNTSNTAADPASEAFPSTPTSAADPLIRFNRAMFSFNDGIDNVVMRPIASFYNKIMPKPLNAGISNFFNNIGELPTIANDILQLHFYQMANDMWRFGINSTLGIGGLFDIASRIDLKYYKNDFGLTLAYWGYTPSTYLVLPFFGPNTFRDGLGIPVDYFAFSIYPYINPESLRYQVFGLGVVDRRAQLLKYQSVMEEAAIDRYVFLRNAYIQNRTYQIEQNKHLGYMDRPSESGHSSNS